MATCNKTAVTLNQGRDQQKIPCDNESVIRAPGAAVAHWAHTHTKNVIWFLVKTCAPSAIIDDGRLLSVASHFLHLIFFFFLFTLYFLFF